METEDEEEGLEERGDRVARFRSDLSRESPLRDDISRSNRGEIAPENTRERVREWSDPLEC